MKTFSDGEEIVEPCLQIFARSLGDKVLKGKQMKLRFLSILFRDGPENSLIRV